MTKFHGLLVVGRSSVYRVDFHLLLDQAVRVFTQAANSYRFFFRVNLCVTLTRIHDIENYGIDLSEWRGINDYNTEQNPTWGRSLRYSVIKTGKGR